MPSIYIYISSNPFEAASKGRAHATGATSDVLVETKLAYESRYTYSRLTELDCLQQQLGFDVDVLEIQMNELGPVVDKIFIVESTRTHNKVADNVLHSPSSDGPILT